VSRVDVVVVGGGVAGLAAAHELHTRGASFLLLEAASFGGVVRTERRDGFLLEGGPDSILAAKADALQLARELGIESRLVPTNPDRRTVFLLHKGELHPLPEGMFLAVPTKIGPFLASPLFSWGGKLRMALEVFQGAREPPQDESIASFLRRRFGQEAVERLGEPLLAGIHAGDPESLSIRSTFPRFVDMERRGSLVLAMRRPSGARPGTSAPSAFVSFADGLTELVSAVVASLPAERRRASAQVTGLEAVAGGYTVRFGAEEVLARSVILALPAHRARPLLAPSFPSLAAPLGRIRFASTATVCLGYARGHVEHPLDGYGLLVPRGEGLRTSACSFMSTKFPGRAPEGHVLLRGFLGGTRDPGILEARDAALVDLVRTEMGPVLGLKGKPVLTRVFRWPDGTPQMEVGHGDLVRQVEDELQRLPGLFLTGAGLRVTGIPDAIGDGRRVAVRALAPPGASSP
jgi:oxygen-dependent protoporphyrinogen oxidase